MWLQFYFCPCPILKIKRSHHGCSLETNSLKAFVQFNPLSIKWIPHLKVGNSCSGGAAVPNCLCQRVKLLSFIKNISLFLFIIIIRFLGTLGAVRDCRKCLPACIDLTDEHLLFYVSTLIVLSLFSVNISKDGVSSIRDRRHTVNKIN